MLLWACGVWSLFITEITWNSCLVLLRLCRKLSWLGSRLVLDPVESRKIWFYTMKTSLDFRLKLPEESMVSRRRRTSLVLLTLWNVLSVLDRLSTGPQDSRLFKLWVTTLNRWSTWIKSQGWDRFPFCLIGFSGCIQTRFSSCRHCRSSVISCRTSVQMKVARGLNERFDSYVPWRIFQWRQL